jgi:PleD family two-component response regulator
VKVFMPRAATATAVPEVQPVVAIRDWPLTRKLKVLVVDDDPAVLKGTGRMLDSLGYVSIAAQSGSEALGLIANGLELDIVIADLGRRHDAAHLSGQFLSPDMAITTC